MKDYKLGANEYNMQKYWNERAKIGKSVYEKVCVYNAPSQFNEIIDMIQRASLSKVLKQIPVHNKKVLEIGCGVGRWANFIINKGAEYTGVDISSNMIENAKKNVPKGNFYITNGTELNFPNNYFDLVFSITVLHHIPYDKKEKMIQEICRVTRKGGYIVIMEDICLRKENLTKTFNMFPLSPTEWVIMFNKHRCETINVFKHKFLQSYLSLLTRKFPKITNSNVFKLLWVEIVEKVTTRILPWRFFAGCCIVFKKL